jgi:hypothetical protein
LIRATDAHRQVPRRALDSCHLDRPNYGAAFVAKDRRSAFEYADHQATAAVNIGDVLVGDDRQVVEVRVQWVSVKCAISLSESQLDFGLRIFPERRPSRRVAPHRSSYREEEERPALIKQMK